MKYTTLGRTACQVSRLCLGTMNFGWVTEESDAFSMMDKALELGFNFFDTADVYGWRGHKGLTEEILGRWFAKGDGRRESVVLATKCYNPMGDRPNDQGLSAYHIVRACEDSLQRMQTEHIDLYQMHHVHRDAPWEEIWQAMEQLVRQGKVTYVGSSNFAGWHIVKANEAARRRNFLGLVTEQTKYSLAERTVELEVLPACRDYGVGILPWSPLAGGMLAGMLKKAQEGRRSEERVQKQMEAHGEQISAYESLCDDLGEEPATVALAWLLHNDAVTAPIIGPRTMDQLTGSLRAMEIELDGEVLEKLDDIWPGPGGEAPEAYAW